MKALPAQPSLSPGSIRGTQETNLAPLGSRARGTHRAEAGAVLRAAACRAAPSGRSQRPVAIARVHTGLGRQLDCFLAFAWQGRHGEPLLVAVNYAPNQSQCYVRLPFADLGAANGGCRINWRKSATIATAAI